MISGSRDGAFGSGPLSRYAAGMRVTTAIRLVLSLALLTEIAFHTHWSVAVLALLAIAKAEMEGMVKESEKSAVRKQNREAYMAVIRQRLDEKPAK